ncbi:unnamed protein product [Ilex paraguariensis]|uniref:Uncharacterized protein n=1 Tax=Ilex paraguariensis TaxID=185542 RepID=A0ABC8QWR4_9AQUA
MKTIVLASSQTVVPGITRRSANFHPSIWGDHFLSYASDFTEIDAHSETKRQQLKEEVKKILGIAVDQQSQQLNLIDAIQRLGVSYHFESEIDSALQHIYDACHDCDDKDDDDLYTTALRFRLLRQQGHNVSCDVFKRFKNNEGKFKESLITDVQGLLSLYEATHMRVHREDILDEALAFTTIHLKSWLPHLSNSLAEQVNHALQQPIHKGLTRLETRPYMSIYQEVESHNQVLLYFAKLDFNRLQKVHQRELNSITRWWKDLDFATKLPFARDRLVECYFWILGVYFEPQYFLARKILTKVIAMASTVDDIYDVYGTPEELSLFTDAIERWDINELDQLPEYMRLFYRALIDVYIDMEEEMAREGRSYCIHYAKEAMKKLIRAYFEEAKWFNEGYAPTMEEYMKVALVSSGYMMLSTTCIVGMGELATNEAFDWVSSEPLIVRASSTIARLMDDVAGHEVRKRSWNVCFKHPFNFIEQERGDAASAVECYMKQHGASKQVAYDEFDNLVTNAWKDINQECLHPTVVPMPLLLRILNMARVIDVVYKGEDGYTNSKTKLKNYIISVLINSVAI